MPTALMLAESEIDEAALNTRQAALVVHDDLAARNAALQPGDMIRVRVRLYNPDTGESSIEAVALTYHNRMRVLDALNAASTSSLDIAYRWLCGSKMCGTCAVRMNGREVLACWEAVEPDMLIEPLRNLPVLRDLVVDRTPFDIKVAAFEPWLERSTPYTGFPETLTHQQMRHASAALECIGCMACYSACPVVGLGGITAFAGPAPLVQLAQTALDPRQRSDNVLRSLEASNIFDCVSCYKCEEVCPAHIRIVTDVIEPLKAKAAALSPRLARHPLTFGAIVAARGRIEPALLVLRLKGWRALARLGRVLTLIRRRKIRPSRTMLALASMLLGRKPGP